MLRLYELLLEIVFLGTLNLAKLKSVYTSALTAINLFIKNGKALTMPPPVPNKVGSTEYCMLIHILSTIANSLHNLFFMMHNVNNYIRYPCFN